MTVYTKDFTNFVSSAVKNGQKSILLGVTSEFLTQDEQLCLEKVKSFVRSFNRFPSKEWLSKEVNFTFVDTQDPFEYYSDRFRKYQIYTGLQKKVHESYTCLASGDVDTACGLLNDSVDIIKEVSANSTTRGVMTSAEVMSQIIDTHTNNKLGIGVRGVPTGWAYVDEQMGGHQKGDLNTIVARPGTGKTYILLKMAYEAWKADNKVLFLSMEMSKLLLGRRLSGIATKNNPERLRKYEVSNSFLDFLSKNSISNTDKFLFADSGDIRNIDDLDDSIELLQPDIVFVDSAYLLVPHKRQGNAARREIISAVAEDLKAIAVKRNIPIVMSMQFNRQAKATQKKEGDNPLSKAGIENIAEADVVGQVSSVVIGLATAQKDGESDVRYMGFLKGREGEQGTWKIRYQFEPVNFDFIEVVDGKDPLQDEENDVQQDDLENMSV